MFGDVPFPLAISLCRVSVQSCSPPSLVRGGIMRLTSEVGVACAGAR